jgi:ATP-binding cassette subfamily C protein LapB
MSQERLAGALSSDLFVALARLASVQREAVDRLALQEAVMASDVRGTPNERLAVVVAHLQINAPKWRSSPDASDLPALVAKPDGSWCLLKAQNGSGQWVGEVFDHSAQRWSEQVLELQGCAFATLRLLPPYKPFASPVMGLVVDEIKTHKSKLFEGLAGGVLLTFLGVLVSFYTMQVYDRVIPTGATETLLVLTLGILAVVVMEYATKRLRSRVYESIVDQVDQRLARTVYLRFLAVRLDQMPASVGTLASQLKGYETVRGFLITMASQMAVDAPFALVFVLVIGLIAGPLALVPLGFFVLAIVMGAWHASRIRLLAERNQEAANRKTGLLVETVEAAEIIKSGQGGWRMLGRWLASSDEARDIDLDMRRLNEAGQYRTQTLQQMAYVALVAFGAVMASSGNLTMGGLIACSILSARVFNPAAQLSNQLTQWAHVKAALKGLDAIWKLELDHHGQLQPVHVETLQGHYEFDQVVMKHKDRLALSVPKLSLTAGEKVAVMGPIGAGKTTLLRLLSGMYKPGVGRILLDDMDLAQIAKPKLAEHIGYLPQDGRLLGGTLRENLTLGLSDPGDDALLAAAKATGLYDAVVAVHPQGLQMPINEGGSGLSGGQRQLVNLTRVFLRKPRVWLLDEPTASLDRTVEQHIVHTLGRVLKPEDTLVLVTHKPDLLQLVDRVILVAKHQVLMDGPRDEVLSKLKSLHHNPGNPLVQVVKAAA